MRGLEAPARLALHKMVNSSPALATPSVQASVFPPAPQQLHLRASLRPQCPTQAADPPPCLVGPSPVPGSPQGFNTSLFPLTKAGWKVYRSVGWRLCTEEGNRGRHELTSHVSPGSMRSLAFSDFIPTGSGLGTVTQPPVQMGQLGHNRVM